MNNSVLRGGGDFQFRYMIQVRNQAYRDEIESELTHLAAKFDLRKTQEIKGQIAPTPR